VPNPTPIVLDTAKIGSMARGPRGKGVGRRGVLIGVGVTERDAEDIQHIARAWGVSVSRAAYYLLAGRLAELREERPEVDLVELVSTWLAGQGIKQGHHGKRSAWVAQERERNAETRSGPSD
jgi:hypothetical protein